MTVAAGARGYAPTVLIQPIKKENPEAARYRKMWEFDTYRVVSPGEETALKFLNIAKPPKDAECIDFGCGTGRGAIALAVFGAMKVTLLDFADNCLDPDVADACNAQAGRLNFKVADLTEQIPTTAIYGFCCDVMEHIPSEDVQKVLTNILAVAQHVFFGISTAHDKHGPALIGEPLHLTVQRGAWWASEIVKAGGIIHWAEESDLAVHIYCSGWKDAEEVLKPGTVNTDLGVVDAQVAANIRASWQHARPYDRQNREIILLGGGPSLPEHLEEIRKLRADGAALVTTNGSYNWALDNGLKPSMQIVVDARQFNARFTHPVSPDCLYLIASQAHPDTLEGLPHERTFLWHTSLSEANERLLRELTGHFFPVPGGSTVVLRAIPLLRMLGYWRMHLFGVDSCVRRDNGAHHAYAQTENDEELIFPVGCGGKQFWCTPWQVSQASEFRGLMKSLGDEVELAIYGEGLIAQIVKTGAELAALEEVPAGSTNPSPVLP